MDQKQQNLLKWILKITYIYKLEINHKGLQIQ